MAVGQVLTRIQNCYLVRYDNPQPHEVLVPLHSMAGWSFSDSQKDMKRWKKKAVSDWEIQTVLDEMQKEEVKVESGTSEVA